MAWLDAVRRDGRDAINQLVRNPAFSVVAVVTLALGIGATTVVFSIFNGLLLRSLPLPTPDRLVAFSQHTGNGRTRVTSLTTLAALRRQQRSFAGVCAYAGGALRTLEIDGALHPVGVDFLSRDCFETLGARPHVGRLLHPSDVPTVGTAAPVAVLHHRFWERAFDADPRVVGQTIRLSGVPLTIIGIAEPRYTGLRIDVTPEVSVPLALLDPVLNRRPDPKRPVGATLVIARLADGVSMHRAQAELDTIWPRVLADTTPPGIAAAERAELRSATVQLRSFANGQSYRMPDGRDAVRDRDGTTVGYLLALTATLLVMVTLNVGGVALTRNCARMNELRVRLALGASRGRLLQALGIHGLLLAAFGTVAALPVTWWAAARLGGLLWPGSPQPLTPDGRVLTVVTAVSVAVGLGVGLLPALALGTNGGSLHVGPVPSASRAARLPMRLVLASQVALSCVLLVIAMSVAGNLVRVWGTSPGFRVDGLHVARLLTRPGASAVDASVYYPSLLTHLAGLPGVRSASLARLFPYAADASLYRHEVRAGGTGTEDAVAAGWDLVSPGLFRTTSVPRLEGRRFTWADDATSPPVAVVNQALARRLFPPNEAVGQHLLATAPFEGTVEIVGVVADATLGDLRAERLPIVYRPWLQGGGHTSSPIVQLRLDAELPNVGDQLREATVALGQEYVLEDGPARARLQDALARDGVATAVSSLSSALALLMMALGLYGALAYTVTARNL